MTQTVDATPIAVADAILRFDEAQRVTVVSREIYNHDAGAAPMRMSPIGEQYDIERVSIGGIYLQHNPKMTFIDSGIRDDSREKTWSVDADGNLLSTTFDARGRARTRVTYRLEIVEPKPAKRKWKGFLR